MPECNECQMETRIESLERRVESYEQKAHSTHKEFYSRIRTLEQDAAVQGSRFETILEKLDGLTDTVTNMREKPGKRWDAIVDKTIWAVLAAVIAFLLAKVGL